MNTVDTAEASSFVAEEGVDTEYDAVVKPEEAMTGAEIRTRHEEVEANTATLMETMHIAAVCETPNLECKETAAFGNMMGGTSRSVTDSLGTMVIP